MSKNIIYFTIAFILTLSLWHFAIAQDINSTTTAENVADQEVQQEINAEENITPQELDIKDPRLLPDNPFYFAKNWWRSIKIALTFDPLKKAELEERYANEKLIELKKLINKKKDPKIIEKAKRNYDKSLENLDKLTEKLKKAQNPRVRKFLEKFIKHQMLHEKLLERLEKQVPPQALKKIEDVKKKHLARFRSIMLRLGNKDSLPEALEKALEKIPGSEFKDIKHLEILKRLEEKAQTDEQKEIIQKAEERILNKLKKKVEKLPPIKRKLLRRYVTNISGDKEKQLEILEDLQSKLEDKKDISEQLKSARRELLKKALERKRVYLKKHHCPLLSVPSKDFCQNGRIVIIKDKNGCPKISCISRKEIEKIKKKIKELKSSKQCPDVWSPVCGKDGKTYPNKCFARIAGVEIEHLGPCNIHLKCAKEGEKVNRNPFLGPTDRVCCPGLIEKRVSRSYSICVKPENGNFNHEIIQLPTDSIPAPPPPPEENLKSSPQENSEK